MREIFVHPTTKSIAVGMMAALPLAIPVHVTGAQSLLDRPDNISTDWVGSNGVLYFNFVHRFTTSPPPDKKVSNFPTFLIATGFASKALIGVNYATNSALTANYPNEWEFFGRLAPLQQDDGAPFDLGGQIDYNLSVKGVDGELSLARREGPVRVVAVTRLIADTLNGDKRRFSFGGGGTLRFGRFLAVSGDATTLTDRRPDEKSRGAPVCTSRCQIRRTRFRSTYRTRARRHCKASPAAVTGSATASSSPSRSTRVASPRIRNRSRLGETPRALLRRRWYRILRHRADPRPRTLRRQRPRQHPCSRRRRQRL